MEKNLAVVRAQRVLFVQRAPSGGHFIPYNAGARAPATRIASIVCTPRVYTRLMDGAQVSTDRFRLTKRETMPATMWRVSFEVRTKPSCGFNELVLT